MDTPQGLEQNIAEWHTYLLRHNAIEIDDADELEDHLRDQISTLSNAGLDDDEAFFVAVKRMGEINTIAREFAREYTERLWKQFVAPKTDNSRQFGKFKEVTVVILLAVLSAITIRIPELFGIHLDGPESNPEFYARNFSLFILPFLAWYFVWKRGHEKNVQIALSIPFIISALIMNIMPFISQGDTEILAIIHLPIVLWLVTGIAYTGVGWKDHNQRMNYIRFSGEWFIYYALIALGGGVLIMFVVFIFESIGIDPETMIVNWIMPCGVAGAVLITAWLVEAKQSIIENMAPVLTRIFTPLFVILLLSFLGTMLFTGQGINVERDVLIGFDLLLVIVLGLLLYSISARELLAKPNLFDILQLLLVISALLVDILALLAIVGRISEYGFSPNKVAALGLNILLLINLGWSAVLLFRFYFRNAQFKYLANWQTQYVPVYLGWAAIVAFIFPLIFKFK